MSDKNGVILERFQKCVGERTREEIAKAIGCDTSMVTKHYNGDRTITIDYAVKYAKYFGVSVDYLVGNTDIPTVETDVRAICEYTGLSKQTVVCLHSKGQCLIPKEWTNLIYKTINPFIENLFVLSQENIINLLDEYEYHVNKANKIYNKSQGVFTLKDFEKKYDDWKNEKDLAELKHFQISNAFNKFFNNKLVTDEEQLLSDMKTQMTNKLRELINNEYLTEGENGNDSET